MLRLFRARSPDKYRDNTGIPQEQVRTPPYDRTRVRKRRLGSLAESRLPASRWRLSLSSLRTAHWFLDFPYPAPSRASAVRRLEILPMTERSDPTAALPQRLPALCPANSYYYSSTVEAE